MPTNDLFPEVERPPEGKKCPHCNEQIKHMDVNAYYAENGTAYGALHWDEEFPEYHDSNCNESNYENEEYSCPQCSHSLPYNFFEEDFEEESTEREVQEKPQPVIVDGDRNATISKEVIVERECPECHKKFKELTNEESSFCIHCNADLNK